MRETRRFDSSRLLAMGALITLMFIVLTVRVGRLQLVQSDIYLRQSQTNRVRVVETPALRGLMLDRNGQLVVDNYPAYTLMAVPEPIDQDPAIGDTLLALTGLDPEEFDRRLHRIPNNRFTPVRIQRDVDFATLAAIEERRARMPGILFRTETKRAYPIPIAPHTLGHIGELTENDSAKYANRTIGDIVGLAGLEQRWNDLLSGQPGYDYLEVDALGRIVGPLPGANPVPPEEGSDLILTLDVPLQQRAEELLLETGLAGAAVAIEPTSGEVLVIASKPDYPPSTFAGLLTPDAWRDLRADPGTPLLHRAIQGMYPPGSVFKMAVLGAGLQSGTISPSWEVTCNGGYRLGRRWFRCWNHAGHGEVNHELSIESSCDVFYYLLGSKLGIDLFHDQIAPFAFGERSGIDLPHEAAGLLPGRTFMDRRYGEGQWTQGHLFNIAIGQGDVLATPLQLAVHTTMLANGGWWMTPRLVKQVRRPDDELVDHDYGRRHEAHLDEEWMNLIREDMLAVVEGPLGTAHWLRDPRLLVAGKTGTSQNPHGEAHALFIAFAPYDDPQIAVAVVTEHGEHGSTSAAPIAFKLIRQYLGYDDETWQRYRWQIIQQQRRAAERREQELRE